MILEYIRNRVAVAATDAAMKENYMAMRWIISTKNNEEDIVRGVQTTEQNDGQIPAGEGLGMLDLIKNISKNTKYLQTGGIVIYNDNKKLIREIEKEVSKESDYTQEAGAVVEGIRRELKTSNIDVKIEYINDKS